MRAWLCGWLGHRWQRATGVPTFYTCTRCHEPGFWVPS